MSNFILNKPTEPGPHPPTGVMGFSATPYSFFMLNSMPQQVRTIKSSLKTSYKIN